MGCYSAEKPLDALLPDAKITPGAIATTKARIICKPGYSTGARHVSSVTKRAVYKAYGVEPRQGICSGPEGCEVDHLVSIELGGSNAMKNLWIQPYEGFGAHAKDNLENWLHAAVCRGDIDLKDAQAEIRTKWVDSYQKHIGSEQ